ncbi:MAG: acyloxyacyl hydrolase [Pyrinomonadaceae bacterium]
MFDNLKLFISLFLILFAFIFSISAQTVGRRTSTEIKPNEKSQHVFSKNNDFSAERKFEFNSAKEKNFYFQTSNNRKNPVDNNDRDTSEPDGYKLRRGEKELNIEVGYSPFQPTFLSGKKEYDTTGRSFGMVNLRWGRVIGTVKSVIYEYQIEVTPIVLAFKNEVKNPAFQNAQTTPNVPPTRRETTSGYGFSPVGFRFLFLPEKRLKPFVAAHAGFMFFRKPVPLPDTLTYDFTGDFGGGLQYQIKRNKAVTFGYKYFHISNINIGETNPGYNANVFYVGYSFFYK